VLILVRHGQSTLNAEGRLAGRLDAPLTALGSAQAEATARAVLSSCTPLRIVASPLRRAQQTALAFGLPVETDDRWIELDYGEFDGARLRDVPADLWEAWRDDAGYVPPGGESLTALGRRVRAACADLVGGGGSADRPVVVVSHVSPIKAAVAWALGVGDEVSWRMFLAPASITRVAPSPRGASLHAFNETGHLAGMAGSVSEPAARRGLEAGHAQDPLQPPSPEV